MCLDCGCGGGPLGGGADGACHRARCFQTAAERLRREAAWRDPDEAAAAGRSMEARLATPRRLWFAECAQQPGVEETAAAMRRALERMARVVVDAGGRGSALHDAVSDAAPCSTTTRTPSNSDGLQRHQLRVRTCTTASPGVVHTCSAADLRRPSAPPASEARYPFRPDSQAACAQRRTCH